MRNLVYYVASSLDGFIAEEDGGFSRFPWDEEFGAHLLEHFPETFPVHLRGDGYTKEENRYFDTVLMGRKTYEVGLREGVTCPYPTLEQFVFSRTMQNSPDDSVRIVSGSERSFVNELKQQNGKAIWICGGSHLATTLLSSDLIDRLIVKLNPVLFGSGIPIFQDSTSVTSLSLEEHHSFKSGHVILNYAIRPNHAAD